MRIGPLRHRIAIQSSTPTQGEYGEVSLVWATDATVWASIEPLSGREMVSAQQQHAETTHRIRLRYTTNVTAESRISFDSRTFEIVSLINRKEMNWMLELLCKEVA